MRTAASNLAAVVALSSPAIAADESVASFTLPSGVAIRIIEAPFDGSKHRLKGCTGPDGCLIDGRIPFGSDGGLPKSYVKSITASFKGQHHTLDASQMYNAWGGRPLEVKGTIRYFGGKCQDSMNCSLRGLFSDASGSFVAEWQVVSGVSQRTIITSSSDVMNEFRKNIDPPVFE
jgi:hypothetical protein